MKNSVPDYMHKTYVGSIVIVGNGVGIRLGSGVGTEVGCGVIDGWGVGVDDGRGVGIPEAIAKQSQWKQ